MPLIMSGIGVSGSPAAERPSRLLRCTMLIDGVAECTRKSLKFRGEINFDLEFVRVIERWRRRIGAAAPIFIGRVAEREPERRAVRNRAPGQPRA